VSITPEGDVTVVQIRGSVDGLTADRLLQTLSGQIDSGRIRLVADCSALDYTSSAGLRALLGTVKATRQKGGDLRLAAVRPPVMKVLELSGFTSILKSFPDVQRAVASFAA
jgi:anti-sigma B factor antagonist